MQGCTYEKSYKKLILKKNKFNVYKIKKKITNESYLPF
jgi:hypothetical protein